MCPNPVKVTSQMKTRTRLDLVPLNVVTDKSRGSNLAVGNRDSFQEDQCY